MQSALEPQQSNQEKVNLIYVASIGRSGSTLLESLLGAHSQIATCGEIHIWPHEILQKGVRPCVCGESVLTCPIWTAIQEKVDPLKQPHPQIHFFREEHHAGHTLRPKRLKEFRQNDFPKSALEEMQVYGQNNYEIFKTFLEVMRAHYGDQLNWIVDSSKDPYRLLWLAKSGLFNIKVLHIVRNPPAFVYSMLKKLPKDKIDQLHSQFYETSRQSLKWSIENYLISQIAKNHLKPSEYFLVKYEELASNPEETFMKICDMLGCEFEEQAILNFREGSKHTIAGNPMRYEDRGIALDERWKSLLPVPLRELSKTFTYMNRSHYGY